MSNWTQIVAPWVSPFIFALAAGVWALRPNMTRRMLVTEIIIGLVLFDAMAVGVYYANAALYAAVSEGPLTVDVWWTVIHVFYFHALVIMGAWVGWRVRRRPV